MLTGGLKSVLVALALGGSLSAVACGPAFAGKRMALVIGNAAYRNVPALRNPINDARGVQIGSISASMFVPRPEMSMAVRKRLTDAMLR